MNVVIAAPSRTDTRLALRPQTGPSADVRKRIPYGSSPRICCLAFIAGMTSSGHDAACVASSGDIPCLSAASWTFTRRKRQARLGSSDVVSGSGQRIVTARGSPQAKTRMQPERPMRQVHRRRACCARQVPRHDESLWHPPSSAMPCRAAPRSAVRRHRHGRSPVVRLG